ncbi:MAG TPA: polysaccharide biosynthesis tyrosine autokinase [Planctomycetota bacterium]|nr:polysaccharide biosynthesis tyrosine autokinase [Planctomycetota bacterium]
MNDTKSWEPPNRVDSGVPQGELLMLMWRYKWLIASVMTISAIVAFIYLKKAMPSYTATSRLYVQSEGPRIVPEFQGLVQERTINFLYTQCEFLRSTAIIRRALEKPGIRDLPTFRGVGNQLGYVKGGLKAKVGAKDDIIDLSFDAPYADDAAKIVNAVVEAYVDFNAQKRQSTAAEVLNILQQEKTTREKDLREKLEALIDFRRENGVLSMADDNTSIATQRLMSLGTALTDAHLQKVEALAAYSTAKTMMENPALVGENHQPGPIFGGIEHDALSAELLRAQTRVLTLQKTCTEEHPMLQDARINLDLLRKQYMAIVQQRVEKATKRVSELEALVNEQQEIAKKSGVLSATYALLEAEVRRTERLCDILDNRIKEINIAEDGGALSVSVLEMARLEEVVTNNMKKIRVMIVSLMIGAMLSIGMALAHDRLDQRLKSADEIATVTGAPVLGVVPSVSGHLSRAAQGQVVHVDPMSHAAEAYRTIRTAIYFGLVDEKNNRLLVTSPIHGEGKTTVASNLAIAMAQTGQRTLLVDADFRKPTQQTIFQVKGEDGLSSVLGGKTSLRDAIFHTTHKDLDVLPCGMIPPNPSEMLNSMGFLNVLDEVSQQYDRVIVDSPPIMPVADARILGAMCNSAILVVRAERSTRGLTEKACAELRSVGTSIFGVVVNGVTRSRSQFGYFHDYAYPTSEKDETAAAGGG